MDSAKTKLRQATIEDFEALNALWEQAELQLYPKLDEQNRFEAMVELNPDLCLLLIDQKHHIVASILGGFDGRTASINRLAIHPNLQKKGYGKYLVNELENVLREKGVRKIMVQIHIKNTQIIPFYEKLGFQNMSYVKMLYKDF